MKLPYVLGPVAAALALCVPLSSRAQAGRQFLDGTWQSAKTICPAQGIAVDGAQSVVGYLADTSAAFPATGDVTYVHAFTGNVSGCVNDAVGVEFGLPDGASWAIDAQNPVVCQRGTFDQHLVEAVPDANNSGCSATGEPGTHGGTFFGWSAVPPGWFLEIMVPVRFDKPLLGLAGPASHRLTATVSSSFGVMSPFQPVTVTSSVPIDNLTIDNLSTHDVGSNSADLGFDLRSSSEPGQLFIDYGETAGFGSSTAAIDVPSTRSDFTGSTVSLTGLEPGRSYFWRVRFVTNIGVFTSATAQFSTRGAGSTFGASHLTTINGFHYDFQAAGEFVLLRNDALEIQVRQSALASPGPLQPDPQTGLSSCASVNSAVAIRIGSQRVTYQASPDGLQLRIDGELVSSSTNTIELHSGAHLVQSSAPSYLQIRTPAGVTLTITTHSLNVELQGVNGGEGLLAATTDTSWLPPLPGGGVFGSLPADLHERYVHLYEKLGNAWRVSDASSLFDYAVGTSTSSFTRADWPLESAASCSLPDQPLALRRLERSPIAQAREACGGLTALDRQADCERDVAFTGDSSIAQSYLLMQELEVVEVSAPE